MDSFKNKVLISDKHKIVLQIVICKNLVLIVYKINLDVIQDLSNYPPFNIKEIIKYEDCYNFWLRVILNIGNLFNIT